MATHNFLVQDESGSAHALSEFELGVQEDGLGIDGKSAVRCQ